LDSGFFGFEPDEKAEMGRGGMIEASGLVDVAADH
jgi:hypothetical protein